MKEWFVLFFLSTFLLYLNLRTIGTKNVWETGAQIKKGAGGWINKNDAKKALATQLALSPAVFLPRIKKTDEWQHEESEWHSRIINNTRAVPVVIRRGKKEKKNEETKGPARSFTWRKKRETIFLPVWREKKNV